MREELLTETATEDLANWRPAPAARGRGQVGHTVTESTNTRDGYSIWQPDDEHQVERHLVAYDEPNHAVHIYLAGSRD